MGKERKKKRKKKELEFIQYLKLTLQFVWKSIFNRGDSTSFINYVCERDKVSNFDDFNENVWESLILYTTYVM